MKKRIKIITTVILFAILLSTALCCTACKTKLTTDQLPEVLAVSERIQTPPSPPEVSLVLPPISGPRYIALLNRSDGYTLRFESNDAWELTTVLPIDGKESGDSVNGEALNITEKEWLLNIKSTGKVDNALYISMSIMKGNKCVGYTIASIAIGYIQLIPNDYSTYEFYFTTKVCDSKVFDKPQPYSEVQKAFAKYKAA